MTCAIYEVFLSGYAMSGLELVLASGDFSHSESEKNSHF